MGNEYKELLQELHKHRTSIQRTPQSRAELDPTLIPVIERSEFNFFHPLTDDEIQQLIAGDGDELDWKIRQVNSSAALLLNVFHALRPGKILHIDDIGDFKEYDIEVKLPTLLTSRAPANIDMLLENEATALFIESKFTEPFHEHHNGLMTLNPSYSKLENHIDSTIHEAIVPFLETTYHHYDAVQLLRHAVGIYRSVKEQPKRYCGKRIVLMNLVWEIKNIQNKYPALYEIQMKELTELNEFAPWFQKSMNAAFQTLGVNFEFVYMNYEDFVHKRTNIQELDIETFEYLNHRYFFQKDIDVEIQDKLKYLYHSVPSGLLQLEIVEMIHDMEIMSVHSIDAMDPASCTIPEAIEQDNVVVVCGSPTPSDHILPLCCSGNFALLNSSNHYRKGTALILRPLDQSRLDYIPHTVIHEGHVLRLEDLLYSDEVFVQCQINYYPSLRGQRGPLLSSISQPFFEHDFKSFALQPLFYDLAKRKNNHFIYGFEILIDDHPYIYYAHNKSGQYELHRLYYQKSKWEPRTWTMSQWNDLLFEERIDRSNVCIHQGSAQRLYEALKKSGRFNDFNIYPDYPIPPSNRFDLAQQKFVKCIEIILSLAEEPFRSHFENEYFLIKKYGKLRLLQVIQEIMDHARQTHLEISIAPQSSALCNQIFGMTSMEKNQCYPLLDLEFMCGRWDDGIVLDAPKSAMDEWHQHILANITSFHTSVQKGIVTYVLVDSLKEALKITQMIEDLIEYTDEIDGKLQEFLIPKEVVDCYSMYWDRFSIHWR